jgi:hypothetical protein
MATKKRKRTRRREMTRVPWIGMVHVKPLVEGTILESAAGGFAITLAKVSSATEYVTFVERHMSEMRLAVIEIEDVERLAARQQLDPHFAQVAAMLTEERPVQIGSIDRYLDDEAS